VDVRESDYSEASMISILNSSNATALVSFVNCPNDRYVDIHCAFLNACMNSEGCKRFIPSEWAGNIDDYPLLPSFYATSREPFRRILRESNGVEWTLFNGGWLMDYFLPREKTYMPPIPEEFPVDPNNWRACIRGTGDEMQVWTCAREIGKAVVELLAAAKWVRVKRGHPCNG
jgi:swainsonine biosynthesis oxidoreductase SwnR